jgi:hypothetical protein
MLRDCWYSFIVPNVHAPCEYMRDDVKDSFYEKVRCVFDEFLRYDVKILLHDFSVKVGRERIWNESSHDISNDNGVESKLCHI